MKTRSLTLASLVALSGSALLAAPSAFADAPLPPNADQVNDLSVNFKARHTTTTETDTTITRISQPTGLGGQKFTVKIGDGAPQERTYTQADQPIVTDWLPGAKGGNQCLGTNEVTITPGAMLTAVNGSSAPITLCQLDTGWVVKAGAGTNPNARLTTTVSKSDVVNFEYDWTKDTNGATVKVMPLSVEVRDAVTKKIIPGAKVTSWYVDNTSITTIDKATGQGKATVLPVGPQESVAKEPAPKTPIDWQDFGGATMAPGASPYSTYGQMTTPEGYKPLSGRATLSRTRTGYALDNPGNAAFSFDPQTQTLVMYNEPLDATPSPSDTDTPAPSDSESPSPSDTETPAPSDTDTPEPSDSESPAPSDTVTTPAPSDTATSEAPEPSDTATTDPAPSDSESPSPSESSTESPAPSDTSSTEAPTPSDSATTDPAPSESSTNSPAPSNTATSTESPAPSDAASESVTTGPKVQTDGSSAPAPRNILAAGLAALGLGGLASAVMLRARRQD